MYALRTAWINRNGINNFFSAACNHTLASSVAGNTRECLRRKRRGGKGGGAGDVDGETKRQMRTNNLFPPNIHFG